MNIGQNQGLARLERAPIGIAAGGIGRRDPMGLEIVEGGKIVEGEILGLSNETSAEKKEHPSRRTHPASVIEHAQGIKSVVSRGNLNFKRMKAPVNCGREITSVGEF